MPSYTVYEDDKTLAFLDVNPLAPGHTLVIPKSRAQNIIDLSDEDNVALFDAVKKVTTKIEKGLDPDGFTIGINHTVGQAVQHIHVHIIPRWDDDGGGNVHSIVLNPPKEELEDVLKRING